jgi:hypothetical protein
MEAEGDRHRDVAGRREAGRDLQGALDQGRFDLDQVRERERLQEVRVGGEVEAGGEHTARLELGMAVDPPAGRRRQQAVHRQSRVVVFER